MSTSETEDRDSADISDALISEAARLESEYRDQIAEEPETAPDEPVTEVGNLEGESLENSQTISEVSKIPDILETNTKGESLESSQLSSAADKTPDTSTKESPMSNTADTSVKRESLTPEQKKVERSSLKRKAADDALESIRPQPPDAKPLKKGFKIPKLSKQGSGASKPVPSLTEDQRQFLAELERDFAHRYTDQDEDYKKACDARFSPPLVENFFCPPKRQFNRPEGSSHYDRNNRNSSPYGHSPRYSQYPPKYSRDYSNSRDGRDYANNRYGRDYSNSRDGRDYSNSRDGRDYSNSRDGRDYSNSRDGRDYPNSRDGRDYSNNRHHH